ncbi:cell separation during budding [Gryganskiella cystojenkinii]|nr:cell separation during budding [Gryganskiella cystojenkinii]
MTFSDSLSNHREGLTTLNHDWTMLQAKKLVQGQKPVQIEANTSIENACEILHKSGVSCAPVYDSARRQYVGMFDYGDLMTYVLLALKKMEVPLEDQSMEMRDLIHKSSQHQQVPVKLASDLSGKDPFCAVMEETRLGAIVNDFGSGIHRVAVMDSNGDLSGILSQSSALDFLMRHLSEFSHLQPLMQRTLHDLGLTNSRVLAVKNDAQVMEALLAMSTNNVTSVAVLDDQGVLIGNISMADIQFIMKDLKASWLWLSCFQFVSKVRQSRGVETGEDQYPILDVNATATFGYALAKLQATKVHRLWVVNDQGLVEGVISLTDVFKILSSHTDS